jgi:hypothetical protein
MPEQLLLNTIGPELVEVRRSHEGGAAWVAALQRGVVACRWEVDGGAVACAEHPTPLLVASPACP